jgi:outer membrane protein assembly factor BamE (lipoprotein component of BamABCDE complex)
MRLHLPFVTALPLWLLGACTTAYSIARIQEGETRDSVEARFGVPSAVYTMPDGHPRLEFHRMSLGLRTYMIDIDATGHVVRVDQVLDESHFLKMHADMSEAEVLSLIGPPNGHGHYTHPEEAETWIYSFETIQRCVVFELPFDIHTHRTLEGGAFPTDKRCGPVMT